MKEYQLFLLVSIWMNLVIHTSSGNVHIRMMFTLLVNVTFLCDYIPDHLKGSNVHCSILSHSKIILLRSNIYIKTNWFNFVWIGFHPLNLVSHKTCDFGKHNQHVVGFTEEHEEKDCRERCEKFPDCNFLFYNAAKKCVMYNSCDQYRTAATAGHTLKKIDIGTVTYLIFYQTSNVSYNI